MKQFSAACDRNREPIGAVLKRVFPTSGLFLEIASGSGQHAVYFAGLFPEAKWQPTDFSTASLMSIERWIADSNVPNVLPPLRFNVTDETSPVATASAMLNCNMIHISPWATCSALYRHAAQILSSGGVLVQYGPFLVEGVVTAPSNLEFDAYLRGQNSEWGIRRLADVEREANGHGLRLEEVIEMPANNLALVIRKN